MVFIAVGRAGSDASQGRELAPERRSALFPEFSPAAAPVGCRGKLPQPLRSAVWGVNVVFFVARRISQRVFAQALLCPPLAAIDAIAH